MVKKHKLDDDARARAMRKPLPKTLRAWMAEVEGIQSFVKKRPQMREATGKAWIDSMQAYHRDRLQVLSENPPALLPKDAAVIICREVQKVLG